MLNRTIVLNPIEPALLSVRSPLGLDLDLGLTFLHQDRSPVDPTPLKPQLALLPRSAFGVFAYDVETTSSASGSGKVSVPGSALVDFAGYNLELYQRREAANPADPLVPVGLLAKGVLRLEGSAYVSWGPLSPLMVPVVVGPPGPAGSPGAPGPAGPAGPASTVPGPPGAQGVRGGIWFVGEGYPMIVLPGPEGLIDGDMYLKTADPNIGWTWRRVSATWIAATNILGPIGPEGPQGPQGAPGASGTMTAIVSETPPPTAIEGMFWYRPSSQQMFIRQGGFWVLHTADWAS